MFVFSTPPTVGLHLEVQEEPRDSSVATQLDKLRQQYNILEQRCAELEHMLEEEHTARQDAETVASEVKQELLMYDERYDRYVSQIREEIESTHKRESDTQADLICMLKLKFTKVSGDYSMTNARAHTGVSYKSSTYTVGRALDMHPSLLVSREGTPSDTSSTVTEGTRIISHRSTLPVQADELINDGSQITSLSQLPMFGNKGQGEGDSYDRWHHKLDCHAALQKWSLHEKLLQFELRLTGNAEQIYEVLPADVKKSSDAVIKALREQLNPVRRDALASAQLMRRK